MVSTLDRLYARRSNRLLFFRKGWGDRELLARVAASGWVVGASAAIEIIWEETGEERGAVVRRGRFLSPGAGKGLPEASRYALVEFLLPRGATKDTPVVLHFASTGDEGFRRRRTFFALPLLRRGIGSLILENPLYGRRRPPDQQGKMLNRFSDLWIMGQSALEEGRALLAWLQKEGFRRLGVCGISMGGSLAAQTAALAAGEVAVAACIAPHSASVVFTEGLLKDYCAWDVLEAERDAAMSAVEWVRRVLEWTDVRRYPPPVCPQAARLIGARRDAYIPPWSMEALHRHWPGSQLRWIDTGHVGAFLFHRGAFLRAIEESLRGLP